MTNQYLQFSPELIVEATSVCDRICPGCYAPNVVSKEDTQRLLLEKPDLFLAPDKLQSVLLNLVSERKSKFRSTSIRGGEPTRHPNLALLLEIIAFNSDKVYIETHGRWAAESSVDCQRIFEMCRKNDAVIKVSFDKMHGGQSIPLRIITEKLEQEKISFVVAITEFTLSEFLLSRSLCDWIPDSQIIFQQKARKTEELIAPEIAVIRVNGFVAHALNSRADFQIAREDKAVNNEVVA
jgi:organic radical activating enzyme